MKARISASLRLIVQPSWLSVPGSMPGSAASSGSGANNRQAANRAASEGEESGGIVQSSSVGVIRRSFHRPVHRKFPVADARLPYVVAERCRDFQNLRWADWVRVR